MPGPGDDVTADTSTPVFGVTGWKNSGKTTMVERLVAELTGRGRRVSTVKHAHHTVDIDHKGRDSHRHRMAGASQVLVASGRRWALMHELRGAPEPPFRELLAKMSPVDLLIVEGFKADHHPKIEVHRAANGKPLMFPTDPTVVGVAADIAVDTTLPVVHLDDIPAIARIMRTAAVPAEAVLAYEGAGV